MTSPLSKELVFLVLQFLKEEKFKESLHILEKESGLFFNMNYFENIVMNGELEDAEKYLRGFTRVEENRFSMKMFFEIRKQRYLEALDKHDHAKAVEILRKDLKLFETFNESLYKEITHLLTMRNFRENAQLANYIDAKTSRAGMMVELKRLLDANPHFHDKLQFPDVSSTRLRTLINQSLNWQHQLCKNPKLNPEIKTLFQDHTCGQSSSVVNPLMASLPNVGGFPVGSHGLLQPIQSPVTSINGWLGASSSSSVPHMSGAGGPVSLGLPSNAVSTLKRPRSPLTNNSATDNQSAGRDHAFKRMRPIRISEEANNLPHNVFPISYTGRSHIHSAYSSDDLPINLVVNLSQGSAIKSMDFHPSQQTLLLVGTNIGDVAIWDVSKRERLIHQTFKVWNLRSCSITLQATLSKECTASVNRVIWSPDRTLFGVAYSKHIIHLYYYQGGNELRNHLEIEAHMGNVGDIAFSSPPEHLYVVSCGEDKSVKVWDTTTGSKLYMMEGHEAAVYSVCPHYRGNVQFIFSTAIDGKIKAWLYDNVGARVQFDAPGGSCITMAYSADGTRLFCCGTNKEGESYLAELSESEGIAKRSYSGLGKQSVGVVQFDTVKNRFLAVGDESVVKIWDMDEANVIMTIDADGGLPASPCIRFNKDGTLLAISTSDNGFKILANAEAPRTSCVKETGATDKARVASSSKPKGPEPATVIAPSSNTGTSTNIADKKALVTAVVAPDGGSQNRKEKIKILKSTEINETSQIRSFRLPGNLLAMRIVRLIYTHSGSSILALQCNAVHKLWKWLKNEKNTTGKATTAVPPQFWQPASGAIMVNDICETSDEDAVPCFALSRNDSYTVSASGGKISLFNMMTFKTLTTILSPPPVATCLAFDPQDNNVIAIGMEDATIQIYHVRLDEVKVKFKGHQKRVTGLAFSNVLGILVSSGADGQVCVWSRDDWERKANKFLSSAQGRVANPQANTYVKFNHDQTHVLAIHETQIAVYDSSTLDCIKQWVPGESSVAITDATYSCDGQSVYASLDDGSVHILTAPKLQPKCMIKPTSYLASPSRAKVYPVAIAAHPSEPNQFALGLSDGGVHVVEPLEGQGKWGNDASESAEETSSASTSITPIVAAEQVTPR